MPVPTSLNDLSTTPASNFPAGSESPSVLDDTLRAHAALMATLRDQKLNASAVSAFGLALVDDADAAAARTTLDVPTRAGGNASGTWGINVTGNAATATNASQFGGQLPSYYQQALGFTPVQQSGGASMDINKVHIGWDSGIGETRLQIDATQMGAIVINRSAVNASASGTLYAPGTAPLYACRAWVNFNGTGTVSMRAQGNVSSISDLGAGDYRINFSTGLPDANYAVVAGGGDASVFGFECIAESSTAARIIARNTNNGTNQDVATVMVAVFR